jgi:cytochrome oxidase Cu insertion factor (SCO1/SenC/PrrC family)
MIRSTLAVAACLGLAAGAAAQRSSSSLPAAGDALPNVTGYDADGNRFELSSLHGKHAVIVFGCLT